MKKRFLAIVLAIAMVFPSASVYAETGIEDDLNEMLFEEVITESGEEEAGSVEIVSEETIQDEAIVTKDAKLADGGGVININISKASPLKITSQPTSLAAKNGQSVTFKVTAENVAEGGYQWYYSKDGVKWAKSTVSSATTGTLSLKVSDTNKGNLYRCTLTGLDGNKVNSQTAGIVVINSQPENVTGAAGKTVYFTVSADNISSYQWQYTKDGVKWSNSTVSSATTQKLSLKVSDTTRANTYRCKLTTTNGIIFYTDSVKIIPNSVKIILEPMNMTCRLGEAARFSVHAENVASYQWQYSKDGVKWSNSTLSSAKTDTITFKVSDSNKSNHYRCKMIGEDGAVLYTKTVAILLMPQR